MRECGREVMGFYPTPPVVVKQIARLLHTGGKKVTILDAGAGDGSAVQLLSEHLEGKPELYGVELDKSRWEQANEKFKKTGGKCQRAAVEDLRVSKGASILWFNPPYDNIRGFRRTESVMFDATHNWAVVGGLIICILPEEYIFNNYKYGFTDAFNSVYEELGLWRFPDGEYEKFNQWVVIGRRRPKRINTRWNGPEPWKYKRDHTTLDEAQNTFDVPEAKHKVVLRVVRISEPLIYDTIEQSPVRGALLREAITPAAPTERPLLPLKEGHLALALAGGLCDSVVEAENTRFLVKGSLTSETRKVSSGEKTNKDGEVTHLVDTYRTVYRMTVRCLLENGTIEDYSSLDDEEPKEEVKPKAQDAAPRKANRRAARMLSRHQFNTDWR